MIRQLHIENFRCLRNVQMNLEPLTVFVGANASGKSSVFSALCGELSQSDTWQRDHTLALDVRAVLEDGAVHRRLLARPGFPQCQVLQLDADQLRNPTLVQESGRLARSGQGLANVLQTLPRRVREQIAHRFCELVPMFNDVDVRPTSGGSHWLVFQDRWRPEVWYEPAQVSDGSLLLLAFLLLPYQSPPPDVIAIEEPERGLHPFLMGELVSSLRKLANGELGPRKVQVLLATHSAELLEFVEPKEVRFFTRSKESGETKVEEVPANDPNWLKSLQTYDNSLGDLWLSGGLGGVPGS